MQRVHANTFVLPTLEKQISNPMLGLGLCNIRLTLPSSRANKTLQSFTLLQAIMLQYFCGDGINSCSLSCVVGKLENLKFFFESIMHREFFSVKYQTYAILKKPPLLAMCDLEDFLVQSLCENATNGILGMLFRNCLQLMSTVARKPLHSESACRYD